MFILGLVFVLFLLHGASWSYGQQAPFPSTPRNFFDYSLPPTFPIPENMPPAPSPLQAGSWSYQSHTEGDSRVCILVGRLPENTLLVFRVTQNYGPDLTVLNPPWRATNEHQNIRVTIGAITKNFPGFWINSKQFRADLVAHADAMVELLEVAEMTQVPFVQVSIQGQRPISFSGRGLRETFLKFAECIQTMHGPQLPPPVSQPRRR